MKMILDYRRRLNPRTGSAYLLCEVARLSQANQPHDCCNNLLSCDTPCDGQEMRDLYHHGFGIFCHAQSGTMPFPQMETEIRAGRPLLIAQNWQEDGAEKWHLMLVYSIEQTAMGRYVDVHDPACKYARLLYDRLPQMGIKAWHHTWLGF